MDSFEDFTDQWIDIQIQKIEGVMADIEEIDELPSGLWPQEEIVDQYEMFILGSVTASIEWIAILAVENSDEVAVEDISTSSQRTYAHERVEERRKDIEAALER